MIFPTLLKGIFIAVFFTVYQFLDLFQAEIAVGLKRSLKSKQFSLEITHLNNVPIRKFLTSLFQPYLKKLNGSGINNFSIPRRMNYLTWDNFIIEKVDCTNGRCRE